MSAQGATLCRMPENAAAYWGVVGLFVDNEANRQGFTISTLALKAGLSRQTVSKLVNGSGDLLDPASLARLEGALSLPRDMLTYIASRDMESIFDASNDRDLDRWLTRKFADADAAAQSTPEEIFDAAMKGQVPMAARDRGKPKA